MELQIRDLQDEDVPVGVARRAAEAAAQVIDLYADLLTLVFVDDAYMQELNREFRNRDCPTDVISFEAEEEQGLVEGEIIISVETARRQGDAAGHGLEAEIAWLVAHGVLHTAGMDDETEEQLARMIELQRQVMTQIGQEFAA